MAKRDKTHVLFDEIAETIAEFYCTTPEKVKASLIDTGADEHLMDVIVCLQEEGY